MAVATASTLSPLVDQSVSLSAASSYDPDGTVASYAWDLDGNSSFETTGATASVSFPNAGIVIVALRVTDNLGVTSTVTNVSSTCREPDAPGGGGETPPGGTTPPGDNGNPTPPSPATASKRGRSLLGLRPERWRPAAQRLHGAAGSGEEGEGGQVYAKGLNIGVKASARAAWS